jgi:hypothetical protein
MGSGREKRGYLEIDETRQSAADDRFEEILEKVKAAGAVMGKDETETLYSGLGEDDLDIGQTRKVEFNLAGSDFLITREVKDGKVEGQGHNKSVVDLAVPKIDIRLKRKPERTDEWMVVELDSFM